MSLKYPRTFHFPYSLGASSDDKIATDISHLINAPIIITEKCDGSNFCLEREACFARTHSGPPIHPAFDFAKAFHASVKYKIPENIQLFGEEMFAVHSIKYTALPGYFLLFNVRDCNNNTWASWEEVSLWAEEIDVPTVPVLFDGMVSSEKELKDLTTSFMSEPSKCGGEREGVVVRVAESFHDDDFASCIMKNVRAGHVGATSPHWKHQEIIKNTLIT